MINHVWKQYPVFKNTTTNDYGEEVGTADGNVKMAIFPLNIINNANITYQDCEFIGLTTNADIDASYTVIDGSNSYKVKYVIDAPRYRQVFMRLV